MHTSDRSTKTNLQSNPKSTNVKTSIDNLAKDEPGIPLIYDYYCEIVHPNLGRTFLLMGDDQSHIAIGGNNSKVF